MWRDSGFASRMGRRRKLGEEISLATWQDADFKLALLILCEVGTGDMDLISARGRVGDCERAAAANLEAIVKGFAFGEPVGSEAGTGVVDFEKLDGRAGSIFDGCVDVVGVTAGEAQRES
jgi:hypothetical protein